MKRMTALIISIIMAVSLFTACGGTGASTDNVGGANNDGTEILADAGISEEEFAAMSPEQQQALLDELGMVMQQKEEQKQEQQNNPAPTIDDVASGGSYVVTVGDSMMWNYFELHYENGKLVKIVVSFQKNSEEEAEVEIVEGDAIAQYSLFFIDYTVNAPELVNALTNHGYTKVYINRAN